MGLRVVPPGRSTDSHAQGSVTCPKCGKSFYLYDHDRYPIGKINLIRKIIAGDGSILSYFGAQAVIVKLGGHQQGWLADCPRCSNILFVVTQQVANVETSLHCKCNKRPLPRPYVAYLVDGIEFDQPDRSMNELKLTCPEGVQPLSVPVVADE